MTTREKRKHYRIESLNLLNYLCLDDDENVVSQAMGRTLNVSESGILLETHVPMDAQQIVSLTIGLEDELIDVRGKVVHCKPGPSGKFESGILFLQMQEAVLPILKKYIQAVKKQ